MKKIYLTVVFFLWFINCFGQFTHDFHTTLALHGKIDSVISKILVEYKREDGLDTTVKIEGTTYIFNNNKQLIEDDHYFYRSLPNIGIDSSPVKTFYKYDIDGNLIESQRYFTSGEPWVKNTYLKKNLVIEEKDFFCPDNSLNNKNIIKIDLKGNVLESDSHDKDDVLFTKSLYYYDASGKLIIEDTYGNDGSLMYEHTCKYNEDGYIIEDNNNFGDKEVHTFKYIKYDKWHNWLKKIEYVNGKNIIIHERRITYY